MSKPRGSMDTIVRITFVILMGVLALFLQLIFIAVFVAVVSWYIWKLSDQNRTLEARISALEGSAPPWKKQEKS
jgi:flagellar biogenesis protein FliO